MIQIYCKPYRFNIDVETCKSRLLIINKEHERHGLEGLTKDQKKCWKCQAGEAGEFNKAAEDAAIERKKASFSHLVCEGCGVSGADVDRFYIRVKKCKTCYDKENRRQWPSSKARKVKA